MPIFKIEYEGYAEVIAESEEDAEQKFYHGEDVQFDSYNVVDVWED